LVNMSPTVYIFTSYKQEHSSKQKS